MGIVTNVTFQSPFNPDGQNAGFWFKGQDIVKLMECQHSGKLAQQPQGFFSGATDFVV